MEKFSVSHVIFLILLRMLPVGYRLIRFVSDAFSLFLFLQMLHFARDIATVQTFGYIFADGGNSSLAMTLPPIAAWIAISNCCLGINSFQFSQLAPPFPFRSFPVHNHG
jgi:hypothetical protein